MEKVFGYDFIDGKLVVNEQEAEVVRFVFQKHEEYMEEPPEELVRNVIEEYEADGKEITFEEAKKEVKYDQILDYIAREVRETFGKNVEQSM